jgi:hypothetical protein
VITVQANPAKVDKDKVALWDRDKDHPNGEIFVVGGEEPVQCAETPRVLGALAAQTLLKVEPVGKAGKAG